MLDDGLGKRDHFHPISWHDTFVGSSSTVTVKKTYRILRLEEVMQTLIVESFKEHDSFDQYVKKYESRLDEIITNHDGDQVIGFKSIAAYRCGLDLENFPEELAQQSYLQAIHQLNNVQKQNHPLEYRISDKFLISYLLHKSLHIAQSKELPIQFHTGFGDPDLDLKSSNPLHLKTLIQTFPMVKFVLLHASYPFSREAGFLASVYPNVYVDFGLAVPMLSVSGMFDAVKMLFEFAPTSKILFSTDAAVIPEKFYLATKWGRTILAQVLDQCILNGDLTKEEAVEVAHQVLYRNAYLLYKLDASKK